MSERGEGRLARSWAWALFALSPLAFLVCIAATAAAVHFLPSIESQPAASISALLPANSQAQAAEKDALRLFHVSFLTPWVVVQRDPDGLTLRAEHRAFSLALSTTKKHNPGLGPIVGALPITNALGLFPASREHGTTVLTYLFLKDPNSVANGEKYSQRYASLLRPEGHLGYTGPLAAREQQYSLIMDNLHLVELATVLMILLIVGLAFRSLGAPILTVVTAGLAFVASEHVLGWIAARGMLTMPRELTPVAVALMLGIVTDYSVFFLSGVRNRLRAGMSRGKAVRETTASVTPIVLTAGLLVACGVATLGVGTLGFFRSFGPGMAIIVATGLAMSLVFVPATLALVGPALFWPGLRSGPRRPPRLRGAVTRVLTLRPVAVVVVLVVAAALVLGATGLAQLRLGLALVGALPDGNAIHRTALDAGKGFARGIIAPTELVLKAPGIARRHGALARLQRELAGRPHVAGVLGPADEAVVARARGLVGATAPTTPSRRDIGVFAAPGGDAVRYVLVFDRLPTDAPTIDSLRSLQHALPSLADRAGLSGAHAEYAGETALGVDSVSAAKTSIWRIALVAAAVNLLFLAVFLRSLVAPLYLVAASAIALAATFGLTAYFFQDVLGYGGIEYYLPIAIGVLLVSLGSDYNLFVVGRIHEEARTHGLRQAVRSAAPASGRTISVAGIAMAASFGLVALVPLSMFRVLAFAMGIGILLDTVIVRSLLVPALIVLFGRSGFRRRRRSPERTGEGDDVDASDAGST